MKPFQLKGPLDMKLLYSRPIWTQIISGLVITVPLRIWKTLITTHWYWPNLPMQDLAWTTGEILTGSTIIALTVLLRPFISLHVFAAYAAIQFGHVLLWMMDDPRPGLQLHSLSWLALFTLLATWATRLKHDPLLIEPFSWFRARPTKNIAPRMSNNEFSSEAQILRITNHGILLWSPDKTNTLLGWQHCEILDPSHTKWSLIPWVHHENHRCVAYLFPQETSIQLERSRKQKILEISSLLGG